MPDHPFRTIQGHPNDQNVSRREFVRNVSTATVAGLAACTSLPNVLRAAEPGQGKPSEPTPENYVQKLYESLTPEQRKVVWFDWDHTDKRGLLRTHVDANWSITEPVISSRFFTADQQELIEAIFFKLYNPDWHARIRKQLQDDAGGYGRKQSIALFGHPGQGKFQFVMTGRHLTIRCDGDSADHVAFGGPIFYGHAAQGFDERPDHPGNVFWEQALKANQLYKMLDGKQRKVALIAEAPDESEVQFRGGTAEIPGLPVSDLSPDQQEQIQKVLFNLVEPYRQGDRGDAIKSLAPRGGLAACRIAFYQSDDIGNDGVWDNWRLEGPSFVWHFRGAPHVHVWVNVSDDPTVKISTS